jgi:hypothetical protein
MGLLVLLAWLMVAIGLWIGYQLIQQNGHISLYITSLGSLKQQVTELERCRAQRHSALLLPMLAGRASGTAETRCALHNSS